MSRRLLALLALLAAAGLWVAQVDPARRERDAAREDYARAREERERLRGQLATLERRAEVGRTPEAGAAAARALRAALLRSTRELPVSAVTIAASSAQQGRFAARGQLSAEGRMAELLRVADRLADPAAGVLVERVRLAEVRSGGQRRIRLEVEAASIRSGS